MPIFEYTCKKCGKTSEFLVRNRGEKIRCSCGSEAMEKKYSAFAVSGADEGCACSDGSCGLFLSLCSSGMCGI